MSAVKELEKWKRNQIFDAVTAAGLGPDAFDWDESGEDLCLRHRASGSYFVFGGNPGTYVARYVAGDAPVTELPAYSWTAHMARVERWLGEVKRDIETPDLWAELQQQRELLDSAWDVAGDNTPFNPDERGEIVAQLKELRKHAKRTYDLSGPQLADLDAKLDYLVDASNRLGRKDWSVVFIGAIVGYAFTAALAPDAARSILLDFLSGIARFWGHGLPMLGSG